MSPATAATHASDSGPHPDQDPRQCGGPLARIDAVLRAQPAEFAAPITDIDAELRYKIDQLAVYRRRIAELASGERLVLPSEVVGVLDWMRGLEVSERTVRLERDARIGAAVDTGQERGEDAPVSRLRSSRRLDPQYPRVDRLIDELDAWQIAHEGDLSQLGLPLVDSLIDEALPAWQQLSMCSPTASSDAERPCRQLKTAPWSLPTVGARPAAHACVHPKSRQRTESPRLVELDRFCGPAVSLFDASSSAHKLE